MGQTQNDINMVTISGQVRTVCNLQDRGEITAFTIQNQHGRFYVEHLGLVKIEAGDYVFITGYAFSKARKIGFQAQDLYVLARSKDRA